ncbi:MAG: DUF445 domain-containing protein [Alphaproteobacteria bacterium]|nr:DUF445 domain-containing protein [Alphaproteobacteria bacterium]
MSASTENYQRRSLRRNRLIATALLSLMAALFIATIAVPHPGFWTLLVRAAAEAAVVGALADWFAVTALFRRPLGLPIPHTAILPRSKERIGEGLATFIDRNFLTPELIGAKLRSIDVARSAADWLSRPANADAMADRLVRIMPPLLRAVGDREVREFLGDVLVRQLATIDLAPLLGRAITILMANGFHESVIDRFLDGSREFLTNREDELYAAAEMQRRRWWIPKAVNRQIARVIVGGVKEIISSLREPGTVARQNLLRAIEHLAQELSTSPEYRARIEEAKLQLLEDVEVRAWLSSTWDALDHALRTDLASPSSRIRQTTSAAVRSLGQTLLAEPGMRGRLNRTIEALAIRVIPWRAKLAQFIVEVVRQWDTQSFTDRLELVVGRDLQYIRINGTLVGGLVGCFLYLLSAIVD